MNPATFRKLAALGLTTDQIAGVLEVMAEDASERNAKARARWHKWKANKGSKRSQTLANGSKQLAGVEGSLPKKDIPEEGKKDTGAAKPRVSDLDAFKAELSPILNAERIEALVAVRRKKGATMTANTGKLLVAAIKRCPADPGEVADEMALRNWTSVKPEWIEPNKPKATDPPKPKKTTMATMWHEEARNHGILDDPSNHEAGRVVQSLARGQNQGSGLARRIASA